MYDTNYHRADTVLSATSKLVSAEDGKYLAGGQTLIPTMKQRLAAPSDLVDVSGVKEMREILVSGDTVTVGASCTHSEVANSVDVSRAIPALAVLAGASPSSPSCGATDISSFSSAAAAAAASSSSSESHPSESPPGTRVVMANVSSLNWKTRI